MNDIEALLDIDNEYQFKYAEFLYRELEWKKINEKNLKWKFTFFLNQI